MIQTEGRRYALPTLLAAVDNALRNGSYMTNANLAFEYLCDHLGVDRSSLLFDRQWSLHPLSAQLPDERNEPDSLAEAFKGVRCRFWVCPVPGHSNRKRAAGEVVGTVEWVDDVAYCTAPDCGRTSADERSEEAGKKPKLATGGIVRSGQLVTFGESDGCFIPVRPRTEEP